MLVYQTDLSQASTIFRTTHDKISAGPYILGRNRHLSIQYQTRKFSVSYQISDYQTPLCDRKRKTRATKKHDKGIKKIKSVNLEIVKLFLVIRNLIRLRDVYTNNHLYIEFRFRTDQIKLSLIY